MNEDVVSVVKWMVSECARTCTFNHWTLNDSSHVMPKLTRRAFAAPKRLFQFVGRACCCASTFILTPSCNHSAVNA